MNVIRHKSEESMEDYLESILILSRTYNYIRSVDIANHMNYTKASVSVAMKNLRERGYIEVDPNGFITLSSAGTERALEILERHTVLSEWLIRIGVSPEIAQEDACRMEHDLSRESFEAIKQFLNATK